MGRIYTLTYEAEDASGNVTSVARTVSVLHDPHRDVPVAVDVER